MTTPSKPCLFWTDKLMQIKIIKNEQNYSDNSASIVGKIKWTEIGKPSSRIVKRLATRSNNLMNLSSARWAFRHFNIHVHVGTKWERAREKETDKEMKKASSYSTAMILINNSAISTVLELRLSTDDHRLNFFFAWYCSFTFVLYFTCLPSQYRRENLASKRDKPNNAQKHTITRIFLHIIIIYYKNTSSLAAIERFVSRQSEWAR